MNTDTSILSTVVLFVLIAIYWYWIFELIDHLLAHPRLTKLLRLPVGVFNALFVFGLSTLIGGTLIPYLLVTIILLVEFTVFYQDTFLKNLFCTCACVIHILAFRAITTGIFSMACDSSIYDISNDPTLYANSVLATFIFLNIAVGLVIQLLPLDQVCIVNAHRDQQVFMLAWMLINILYLLFNSAVAENPIVHSGMVQNQIVAPCVILIGTYIMLLFAIKTGKLLDYKEQNAALELTISQEQEYRNAITKDALLTYEFNLNQDLIISGCEEIQDERGNMIYRYSDMLGFMARKLIHPNDTEKFVRYASPSNIVQEFQQGNSEITLEYRQLLSTGGSVWCRAVTNLARDTTSGGIRGFTYVKNIDADKRCQMDLQYKAERDSLTGLYNKGVTAKLITEHLSLNRSHATAALFMIDVDNFKDINDHFGHVYGDTVLCELGEALSHIFCKDGIVGRIGGDEYIAYMKNGVTDEIVRKKGDEICKAFRISYTDIQGKKYTLSGSVGIALSPKDGTTFQELYNHADTALYAAKKVGKNNYQLYNGSSFCGYQSHRP
ncbi:MAG: GGDEF domain-containing protein [Evtepia sp.]